MTGNDIKTPELVNKVPKSDSSPDTNEKSDSKELEDKWLIRDCEIYKDEYKECTSFLARFHQYFIYGETLDCNQWRKDYNNCYKWVNNEDIKAGEAVIASEQKRRLQRLSAHYQNNVWKKRDGPPPDWDKPLPEWMVKRDENTYLAYKAKEMKEGKDQDNNNSFFALFSKYIFTEKK